VVGQVAGKCCRESVPRPCSRIAHCLLKGAGQILGMKAKRPGFALIEDTTIRRDQIEAVGPACIGLLHLVVEAIHHCGKLDSKLPYACASYRGSLRLIARAAEQHLVAHVALHLPHVGGMRLKDIDGVEVDLTLVLFRQFVQGGNLPPKWRSGIAPENQNDRLVCPKGGQLGGSVVLQFFDRKVGRSISNA